MTTPHTPGPLTTHEDAFEPNRFRLHNDGNWLMSILHNGEQLVEKQRENVRRLAACWNACQGIDTDALESGICPPTGALGSPATQGLPLTPTPDDLALFSRCKIDPSVQQRIIIERAIIRRAVTDLLAAGYEVEVFDGEETALPRCTDLDTIMAAIMSTDMDIMRVWRRPDVADAPMYRFGGIQLIYGNDGHDVIADYATNLDDALKGASEMAEAIAAS